MNKNKVFNTSAAVISLLTIVLIYGCYSAAYCQILAISHSDDLIMLPYKGITAHRGNSGKYPQNTIVAFESAIELKVDWTELDIHKTKDGQIVVCHDKSTGRVGDADLIISETDYETLRKVDVASVFRKENNLTIQECPKQEMPLLKNVIKLFLKQELVRVSIQPKADIVKEAIELIRELNAVHIVGFNDVSLEYMSQVKEMEPGIPVFWDRYADFDVDKDVEIAVEKGFESMVVNVNGMTAEKVKKIKAAGIEAGVWTVNDKNEFERLLKMGVDRIYTDEPADLISVKYKK